MKNYIFVYKITNQTNNKIYIGVHGTNDLNDGYFGSSKIVKRSINKYGISYFTKDILRFCDSYEEAYLLETEIVNEMFIKRRDTYNIAGGGSGCSCWTDEIKQKISNSSKGKIISQITKNKMRSSHINNKLSNETKLKISKTLSNRVSPKRGIKLSDEHKKKLSDAKIGKSRSQDTKRKIGKSTKNRRWINKENKTKFVEKSLLNEYLCLGWKRGRK